MWIKFSPSEMEKGGEAAYQIIGSNQVLVCCYKKQQNPPKLKADGDLSEEKREWEKKQQDPTEVNY